jgi:hypothetical protein
MLRPKPFHVCTSCRVIFEIDKCLGECHRCKKTADCLRVETEDDVRTVITALG